MKFRDFLNENVISQNELKNKLKTAKTKPYIKNIVVALIKSTPEALVKFKVGSVDDTKYSQQYLKDNPYILVQLSKSGVDAYIISSKALKEYKETKPTKEISNAVKGFDAKFLIKNTVTQMVKIEDLGIEPNTKIESPWGETQTALKGAFIVKGKDVYVVNAENAENGLPIGYVRA